MKNFAMVFVVLMLAGAAFGQASRQAQLDSCNVRLGDAQLNNRRLTDDNRRLTEEAETCRRNREQAISAANSERDRATAENQNLRNRNTELEAQNRELTAYRTQAEIKLQTLETLVAQNTQLATDNMNLRNQIAAASNAVPAAAPHRFLYPISGVMTGKRVENNVIISDFVFTNHGSRRVTEFDAMARFYWQGNKIYEIQLPTIRSQAGFSRGETLNFRAGLPVIDQNLVNAAVESIDMVVEITNVR